jgi:uncharacterized membrane protein
MTRYRHIDWARGFAVLLMIVCHAFNALAQPGVRSSGAYSLSQFLGGMAFVIFLFLAGVTFSLGMTAGEQRGLNGQRRWRAAMYRGLWVLGAAYLFRIVSWLLDSSSAPWQAILRVDILNCMGAAMALLSPVAMLERGGRLRAAMLSGAAIALAAPFMSRLDWSSAPMLAAEYLQPSPGRFSLFPAAAYLAFGMAAAYLLPRDGEQNTMEAAMRRASAGGVLLSAAGYAVSFYKPVLPVTSYWVDDPTLILTRTGLVLVLVSACWIWTAHREGSWSWVEALGRQSLLVYFAHIAIVYGRPLGAWRGALDLPGTFAVTGAVLVAMVILAQSRMKFRVWARA